jgi:hypothetical protein
MGIDWKRADTDGWEIEDVDKARSVADTCPRCGQASRLLERERVKNLKVFGVSLVATERGGRVFECTLCRARFEAPEGGVASDEELDASVIDQLTAMSDQLDRVEEEVALWSGRVTIAARGRDAALAREAQDMVERRSRAAAMLRADIDRLRRQLRRGSAADETAQAPTRREALLLAPPSAAPAEEVAAPPSRVEDELAALREKVAAKVAAPEKEDELTALKRRLGMLPKEGADAAEAAEAPAEADAASDAPADDELTALKRRLRGSAPAPAPTPEAPAPTEDDEMSDLKSRLRPKR